MAMAMTMNDRINPTSWTNRLCVVCDSKSVGFNFGVPTCSPCKAFFRRNARRKEILHSACQHHEYDIKDEDTTNANQPVRRCSACRLRRCFDMGMKEELVRTEEENTRHKQLVDINRQRRKLYRQRKEDRQLSIPQCVMNHDGLLRDSDWRHLSNIVSAYETYCLTTYLEQRSRMLTNRITDEHEPVSLKHHTILSMNLTISLFSFFRSLPALRCLSHMNRTYLCKTNLRPLIFPNMFELKQLCFSDPWQTSRDEAAWQLICGPELYEPFSRTMKSAERACIGDPIITRLWMVVLFFSSSLFCSYEIQTLVKIPTKKSTINQIQNAYVCLLWNYLSHRYGYLGAAHMYSNLVHVYLRVHRIGFEIGAQFRTRQDLVVTHKMLNQLLTFNSRDG